MVRICTNQQRFSPLFAAALLMVFASGAPSTKGKMLEFASVELAAPDQAHEVLLVGFKKSDVVAINTDYPDADRVSLLIGKLRAGGVVPGEGAIHAVFRDGILVLEANPEKAGSLVVLIRWPHSAARPSAGNSVRTATPFWVTTDGAPSEAALFPVLGPLVLHNDQMSPLPWCELVAESLALSTDTPCPH